MFALFSFFSSYVQGVPIKLTDVSGKFSVTVEIVDVSGNSVRFKRPDGTTGLVPIIKIDKDSLLRIVNELMGRLDEKSLAHHDIKILESTMAITASPTNAAAYFIRGSAHYAKGSYYKQNGWEDPITGEHSYLTRGETEKAIADLTKAIELDPKHSDAYAERARAYKQKSFVKETRKVTISAVDRDKLEQKAFVDLTKAIELNPKNDSYYFLRGTLWSPGEEVKAIADFTKAIELNPKFGEFYLIRSRAYESLGKNKEAKADFDKARELDAESLILRCL